MSFTILLVIGWVGAMIAALSWGRKAAAVFSAAAAMLFLQAQAGRFSGPAVLQLLVLASGPWLLAGARLRREGMLSALRTQEAGLRHSLAELESRLEDLKRQNRVLEEAFNRLGDIYRVTRETAHALRVDDVFAASLESVSRLLNAHGFRLVDFSEHPPLVHRAGLSADGRLIRLAVVAGGSELPALEKAVRRRLEQSPHGCWPLTELGLSPVSGLESAAAAVLLREQQPAGMVIAENLLPEQLSSLVLIADQLSLQLARVAFYRQVEDLAVTDALTGLSVRGYFLQRAGEEINRCIHHKLSCTLLMVDLDFFKQKNDTYGHLVGDVVLKEVARTLKRNLREVDLIGRYGGEEMVLLLIETAAEQAMPVAQRLKQLVELHPIHAYDELLTQTVSIGVAAFPADARNLQQLIERADAALYAAKRAGRNRVVRYAKETGDSHQSL